MEGFLLKLELACKPGAAPTPPPADDPSGRSRAFTTEKPGKRPRRVSKILFGSFALSKKEAPSTNQENADSASGSSDHPKKHKFVYHTFPHPARCNVSKQLMFGTIRQGLQCEACSFACLPEFVSAAPENCGSFHPNSQPESVRDGYGFLKTPKPKGIRQGWDRILLIESNKTLFVFSSEEGRHITSVDSIIDLKSEYFSVSPVTQQDVIHANRKDIDYIFQMVISEEGDKKFFMTQTLDEKNQWIQYLNSAHKSSTAITAHHFEVAIRSQKIKLPPLVLSLRSFTSKGGEERFIVGTEEGLFISGDQGVFSKISSIEMVTKIDIVHKYKFMFTLAGKSPIIQVWPEVVLDNGPGWPISLDITKGCTCYDLGLIENKLTLCVGVKKKLIFLLIDSSKRFNKTKELSFSDAIVAVRLFKDKLCVGLGHHVKLLDLKNLSEIGIELPTKSDPNLGWVLSQNSLIPMAFFKFKHEYLICNSKLGFFVDERGRQTRPIEMKWLSAPKSFDVLNSCLILYHCEFVEIFSVANGKRLETIPTPNIGAASLSDNIFSSNEYLRSLRYIGSDISTEEFVDETSFIDDGPIRLREPEIAAPQSPRWTKSDSNFLRDAIKNSIIEESEAREKSRSESDSPGSESESDEKEQPKAKSAVQSEVKNVAKVDTKPTPKVEAKSGKKSSSESSSSSGSSDSDSDDSSDETNSEDEREIVRRKRKETEEKVDEASV